MQVSSLPLVRLLFLSRAAGFSLLLTAIFLLPGRGFAQSSLATRVTSNEYADPGPQRTNTDRGQTTTTAASLSDQTSSTYERSSVIVSYGSVIASGSTVSPASTINAYQAGHSPTGYWSEPLLIDNPALTGSLGIARLTMHLNAAFSLTGQGSDAAAGNTYYMEISGPSQTYFITQRSVSTYAGTSGYGPADPSNFTVDIPINFGAPTQLTFRLTYGGSSYNFVHPFTPLGASSAGSVSLRSGSIIVLDGNNQPTDFTMAANTGSARSVNMAPGAAFSGFALTNSALGRMGTSLILLGGSSSIPATVRVAFVAPPDPADIRLASDAADFSGTGGDLFVIQMNYDPAVAQALALAEGALRLAWRNPATNKWSNAVTGNASNGPAKFLARAYNPATDFQLGNYGLDTANHVVWAVLHHNSEFGVGVVPDPVFQKILSLTRPNASTIRLQCVGMPNALNRIESSPDLSPDSFTVLTSVMADANGAFQFDDVQASGAKKFYRLAFP